MAKQKESQAGGHISGVSLSSFLQMLEQERKSCTLNVLSGNRQGSFYFDQGVLIDAEFGGEMGQGAAYTILLWKEPVFSVLPPEDRMQRIHVPLAHILLDSAKQSDEQDSDIDDISGPGDTVDDVPDELGNIEDLDPVNKEVVEAICRIAGIKHYFLLSRQGKVIIQSSKNLKIGDFIAYCIVSGIQMRKVLDVKGPSRIQLSLESGETLVIMPGAGVIIGLLLDEFASVNDISDKIAKNIFNR